MKKSELKYLIKSCLIEEGIVSDSSIEDSVMLREGVIKNAIEKFRSKLKSINKGASQEDISKEAQVKASMLNLPVVKQFTTIDVPELSLSEGLFGNHKSNNNANGTIKVGKYYIKVIGTTSKGCMVCTCENAKIRGNLTHLFATEGFSVMNEGVLNALVIMVNCYDNNYNTFTNETINFLKSKDPSCELKISDLNYAWSEARVVVYQETGNSGWIEVVIGYNTSVKGYEKVAMYLSYNPSSDKMYVGSFKWE